MGVAVRGVATFKTVGLTVGGDEISGVCSGAVSSSNKEEYSLCSKTKHGDNLAFTFSFKLCHCGVLLLC